MSPEEELRARPSFEQASREYLAMLDEMRHSLLTTALIVTLNWIFHGCDRGRARSGGASF